MASYTGSSLLLLFLLPAPHAAADDTPGSNHSSGSPSRSKENTVLSTAFQDPSRSSSCPYCEASPHPLVPFTRSALVMLDALHHAGFTPPPSSLHSVASACGSLPPDDHGRVPSLHEDLCSDPTCLETPSLATPATHLFMVLFFLQNTYLLSTAPPPPPEHKLSEGQGSGLFTSVSRI